MRRALPNRQRRFQQASHLYAPHRTEPLDESLLRKTPSPKPQPSNRLAGEFWISWRAQNRNGSGSEKARIGIDLHSQAAAGIPRAEPTPRTRVPVPGRLAQVRPPKTIQSRWQRSQGRIPTKEAEAILHPMRPICRRKTFNPGKAPGEEDSPIPEKKPLGARSVTSREEVETVLPSLSSLQTKIGPAQTCT
jgi:hypothetical protein